MFNNNVNYELRLNVDYRGDIRQVGEENADTFYSVYIKDCEGLSHHIIDFVNDERCIYCDCDEDVKPVRVIAYSYRNKAIFHPEVEYKCHCGESYTRAFRELTLFNFLGSI